MIRERNLSLPVDGVKIQVPNTKAFIGDTNYGIGILCVAESNLIWKQENGDGLCFDYPSIGLHAISKDLDAFPHECLYLITDQSLDETKESNGEENNGSDDSNEVVPIRFVPEDKSMLNPIFQAINECQALYPDEMNSDMDEENSQEDEEEEADENNYANFHDDDYIQTNEEFFDSNSDFNNIQLSERGQQILRRININYETENEKNGNNNANEDENQYEDADISH